MSRGLVVGVASLTLVAGCGIAREVRYREAVTQEQEERARIVSLYRQCLERRNADPTVDCSEYRRLLDVTVQPPQ